MDAALHDTRTHASSSCSEAFRRTRRPGPDGKLLSTDQKVEGSSPSERADEFAGDSGCCCAHVSGETALLQTSCKRHSVLNRRLYESWVRPRTVTSRPL